MRVIEKLKKFPWHVAGISLFFISHGYSEYTWLIPVLSLFLFFLGLLAVSFLLYLLLKRLLSSGIKAGLIVTWLLTFVLFFGAIQELLKNSGFLVELSRYRYLLPTFGLSILVLFIYLKRSRKDFSRITLYLNTLFIVLIVVDVFSITRNLLTTRIDKGHSKINISNIVRDSSLAKPDIYFILLDEYTGSQSLKTYFNYDNSSMETNLRNRGFFVAKNSNANYPATLLAMASTFNMDTVSWLKGRTQLVAQDYTIAKEQIAVSEVPHFLESIGYRLYNYSIFDIGRERAFISLDFIPVDLKLITAKTIVGRIQNDLAWNLLVSGYNGEANVLADRYRGVWEKGIEQVLTATRNATSLSAAKPKFVYSHLMMPHPPFLFDSTGTRITEGFIGENVTAEDRAKTYLQYLVYTNKTIFKLVSDIQDKTAGKAVIMVLSDHGYRALAVKDPLAWSSNINAVYIPGKNYSLFSDSISNVNQFRVLFNTLFKTGMPVLPDTCIFALQTH